MQIAFPSVACPPWCGATAVLLPQPTLGATARRCIHSSGAATCASLAVPFACQSSCSAAVRLSLQKLCPPYASCCNSFAFCCGCAVASLPSSRTHWHVSPQCRASYSSTAMSFGTGTCRLSCKYLSVAACCAALTTDIAVGCGRLHPRWAHPSVDR